jgi:hypothetical protein
MPLNTLIKCKKNKIAVRETNKKTAEEQERRGGKYYFILACFLLKA